MKSVMGLLIQTEFYAALVVIVYATTTLCMDEPLRWGAMIIGLVPFHPTGLWFIPCYALLLFLSPFLNWVCKVKKAHFVALSASLGGIIAYITIGYTGYSVFNFILLYLIGRWIYLYPNHLIKMQNSKLIVLLSLSVAVTFILSIWWLGRGHVFSDKTMYAYSSPWVISSSILLFLCFKNINISYKWVKSIAPSVLSVYLLHENSLINQWVYIKPLRNIIAIIPSDIISYIMLLVYGAVLFFLVVAFDKLVRVKLQDRILGVLSTLEIYQIFDSNLKKLN